MIDIGVKTWLASSSAPIETVREEDKHERLEGGQEVSLEIETLETNLTCLVVTLEGDQATLQPLYKARAANVSLGMVPQRRWHARVSAGVPCLRIAVPLPDGEEKAWGSVSVAA